MKSARLIAALVASVVLGPASPSFGQVSWDDGAGAANDWNASGFANWSDNANPGGKGVTFGDLGTSAAAGTTTNILDTDYTISSLTFNHSNGQFHATDLNGNTLEVGGNLLMGITSGDPDTAHRATMTTSAAGGTLRVLGSTIIGRTSASTRIGRLDVTGGADAEFGDSTADDVFGIGDRTGGPTANAVGDGVYTQDGGTLTITASRVTLGQGANSNNPAHGQMLLTNMTSTSIVIGGDMVVGGTGADSTGTFEHSGGTFSADIGGDLRVNNGQGDSDFTVSATTSATLSVAGGLYIYPNGVASKNNEGAISTVTLPTADVTIGDGDVTDRIVIGTGSGGDAGRPAGTYTQTGGTLAINVNDIELGVGGSGNQGSYGAFQATGMTSTSIITNADWVVGNDNAAGGPNLLPETANFTIEGGTFSGQVGGNIDVMATSTGNTGRSSTLDLSETIFTTAGLTIDGAMRVGLAARGNALLGDGSNPDPLAADVTAGALAVGGAGSNDIGLVELHGTRFAVDDVGGLTLGPNGLIELYYDATSEFDPVDAWLRVPLADEAALQSLIDLDQIQAFVDDGSGFTQQDEFMGDTFGVYSNAEFAFAAFALPQTAAVPEPASLALWSLLGLVTLLTARRVRCGR